MIARDYEMQYVYRKYDPMNGIGGAESGVKAERNVRSSCQVL